MHLFNHILITPVLPGTLILLKNEKENKNYAE